MRPRNAEHRPIEPALHLSRGGLYTRGVTKAPRAAGLCGLAWAVATLVVPAAISGCGGGDATSTQTTARIAPGARTPPTHPLLAAGAGVRGCDTAFIGPAPADWRRHSRWIGPYGLAGRKGPDFGVGSFEDGLLAVKTPTIVAGHRRVTISIPTAQRYRAGILGVDPDRAYARVTYAPCMDKPRTIFAAGFLLRDRRPLTVLVQVGDGPVRGLYLSGKTSSGPAAGPAGAQRLSRRPASSAALTPMNAPASTSAG